jgi:hypothetical protein
MDGVKRVIIEPGISTMRMRAIWEEAIEYATSNPGRIAALLLAPGTYPLPEPGTYEYKEVPTRIHVSPPGAEIQFLCERGKIRIYTYKIHDRRAS